MLNTLLIIALENLREIAAKVGERFPYQGVIEEIRAAARKAFYNQEKGAFAHGLDGKDYTVLGNACAILAGLVQSEEEKKALCEKILSGEATLEELAAYAYDKKVTENPKSGRQEYLQTIVNQILF